MEMEHTRKQVDAFFSFCWLRRQLGEVRQREGRRPCAADCDEGWWSFEGTARLLEALLEGSYCNVEREKDAGSQYLARALHRRNGSVPFGQGSGPIGKGRLCKDLFQIMIYRRCNRQVSPLTFALVTRLVAAQASFDSERFKLQFDDVEGVCYGSLPTPGTRLQYLAWLTETARPRAESRPKRPSSRFFTGAHQPGGGWPAYLKLVGEQLAAGPLEQLAADVLSTQRLEEVFDLINSMEGMGCVPMCACVPCGES